MVDRPLIAQIIGEALAAGAALTRSRFWRYAGLMVVVLLLTILGTTMYVVAVKRRWWAFDIGAGILWCWRRK